MLSVGRETSSGQYTLHYHDIRLSITVCLGVCAGVCGVSLTCMVWCTDDPCPDLLDCSYIPTLSSLHHLNVLSPCVTHSLTSSSFLLYFTFHPSAIPAHSLLNCLSVLSPPPPAPPSISLLPLCFLSSTSLFCTLAVLPVSIRCSDVLGPLQERPQCFCSPHYLSLSLSHSLQPQCTLTHLPSLSFCLPLASVWTQCCTCM